MKTKCFLGLAALVWSLTPLCGGVPQSATVTLQEGLNGYDGTEDTRFCELACPPREKNNRSFGASQVLEIAEAPGNSLTQGRARRTLIRFDLSSVRGKITGAQLVLTNQNESGERGPSNETIALYRVSDANRQWQAGSAESEAEAEAAVWNCKADPSVPWAGTPGLSSPGVDYDDNPLAITKSGTEKNAPVVWTFRDATFLNDWAANPSHNAGFMLQELEADGRGADRFHSSESCYREHRPKLVLKVEAAANVPEGIETGHAPIPVKFTLKEPGFVTLVIEDAQGKRVRNLVSETEFPAGENTVWWDGMDESGKADLSPRGYYKIIGKLVAPGAYRVRGLVRKSLDLFYEFPFYNPGNPPWPVWEKTSSGWLADHSCPGEVLFMPGNEPRVLVGSYIVEGGSSLAWLDLEGRKQRGMGWLGGGNWTGVGNLARDVGAKPLPEVQLYSATTWPANGDATQEFRLIAIGEKANKPVLIHPFPKSPEDPPYECLLGGLAARDGLVLATLPSRNQLLIVDAAAGKLVKTLPLTDARGIAFDAQGRLLALVGKQVQRLTVPLTPAQAEAAKELPAPEILVKEGLDDPQRLALDAQGNLYVSDHGKSHNVKVFTSGGKFVRTIGKPGEPKAGPYDPQRMNHPMGIAVSSDNHLWVAEHDEAPRRVSVWNLDGTFVRAFYGGPQYGGGGVIDPRDKTRLYYGTNGFGLEFKLDWKAGSSQLVNIYSRPSQDEFEKRMKHTAHFSGSPERPIYAFNRTYFTNDSNSWLMGSNCTVLWGMRDGVAVPMAMVGRADQWKGFKEEPFKALLPPGDPQDIEHKYLNDWFFAWSDRNGDGEFQPEEFTFKQVAPELRTWIVPVTVEEDLSMLLGVGLRLTPSGVNAAGVPLYELATAAPAFDPAEKSGRASRFQSVGMGEGWVVQPGGPIYGYQNGKTVWSYPCRWPGLSSMYGDPLEEPFPGQIVGATRLSLPPIQMPGSDVGPIMALHANNGAISLISRDGLFVGTLGQDSRRGRPIRNTPDGPRGFPLNGNTFGEEHFFLNVCQSADAKVYVVTAFGIVRVEGLENVKRLPDQPLNLTSETMSRAAAYVLSSNAAPRLKKRDKPLLVSVMATPPTVDGKLEEWTGAEWATIHPANNKRTGEGKIEAAVAISGDRLYAAFKTGNSRLLDSNSGESLEGLFKTGGALDLMIGTEPKADPKRTQPVAGDIRLLVTRVKDRTMAALYRAVVPGTKTPVPFSSPWRTITLDRVDDVSSQVQLASGPGFTGLYEFSIPLSVLGLHPAPGQIVRGDLGIVRGDIGITKERIYWRNKATGLTSDVPGEAMLTPGLWGDWQIAAPAAIK